MTEDGLKAIMRLSGGDMRKCLNILQSTHLAFAKVDAQNVYLCTGCPLPKDIERIMDLMLNNDFKTALAGVRTMQQEKGISLPDIITNLHELLLRVSMPPDSMAYIIQELADAE
jgi:replication factor C subunit 3/5